jgi:hypothetical protein
VLWNAGISFGGVIAFIFADLIVHILRGDGGFALIVELIFRALGLVAAQRNARVVERQLHGITQRGSISFSRTRWIARLAIPENGRPPMLRLMNRPAAMGHPH